jgi:hypothetical protein
MLLNQNRRLDGLWICFRSVEGMQLRILDRREWNFDFCKPGKPSLQFYLMILSSIWSFFNSVHRWNLVLSGTIPLPDIFEDAPNFELQFSALNLKYRYKENYLENYLENYGITLYGMFLLWKLDGTEKIITIKRISLYGILL